MGRCLGICCVEFDEVMAPHISTQFNEFFVRKVRNQGCKSLRIEQVFADGRSICRHDALLVAIDKIVEASKTFKKNAF